MKRLIDATNGELPPIVTTGQLANYLQVSTRTLSTWRDRRLIPYWRVNNRVIRYPLADVLKRLAK